MKRGASTVTVLLTLAALLLLAGARAVVRLPSGDGDEDSRPWGDCCDKALCTKSYPPVCQCRDEVEACNPACEDCEEVSDDPYRYLCHDVWFGFPGPKCHTDAAVLRAVVGNK